MPRTEFDLTYEALQKKWTCEKHAGRYCYIDQLASGKESHLQFTPVQWAIWARLIQGGKALMDYPPRTSDFEAILEAARKGNCTQARGSKKSKYEDSDSSDGKGHKVVFNLHSGVLGPDVQSSHSAKSGRRYSDPFHSPRKSSKTRDICEVLRDMGYAAGDWTSRGLEDYFKWLEGQYEGLSFQKALTAVQAQDIGLDSFGRDGMDARFLSSSCGISPGDALRILYNFKRWVNVKLLNIRDT
jgi:hypothetical protein